ncbi:MAG: PD40 domain-containing protein [Planctomycetes bacterium]|nr:PD40 domain-containing protein [Planctomycetota bacterium]
MSFFRATATQAESGTETGRQGRRLLIAFASLRERPAFSNVYFYRHDGERTGELNGSVPAQFERADSRPSLTVDGRLCAHASKQVGGFTPQLNFWNRVTQQSGGAGDLNAQEGARIAPALSGDGKWLACCSRGHANSQGGWDIQVFSATTGAVVPTPELNTDFDEQEVTIDGTGRWLAFVSNRRDGAGLSDIRGYDRQTGKPIILPGVNSPYRELNPALSADGRWLAFVSDRPGGSGGKDIYLYDCQQHELVPVPGLNSVAHEQSPALSPDGRFVAFVSERIRGAGERDLYLYDRQQQQLLETPGLNSPHEDFDPALAYEQLEESAPMK